MVFIRTYDPYYRLLIKQEFFEWFGCVIKEPKDGIKTEVLSTFLTSSLNIELVYIILTGITRFSGRYEFSDADFDRFIESQQGKNFIQKLLMKKEYDGTTNPFNMN